jgi:hypothetical protein
MISASQSVSSPVASPRKFCASIHRTAIVATGHSGNFPFSHHQNYIKPITHHVA